MSGQFIFLLSLLFFLCLIIILQLKFGLLKDNSTSATRSYSLARTHLVWWTFIILSSILAVVWGSGQLPTLSDSTLILLGIGSLTTISSRITDISDDNKAAVAGNSSSIVRNTPSEGFFLDILSDSDGVSVHRLQAVVFNAVFGVWFIYEVFKQIKGIGPNSFMDKADVTAATTKLAALLHATPTPDIQAAILKLQAAIKATPINDIMPAFDNNNLILLGMSAGTYVALKTTENSQLTRQNQALPAAGQNNPQQQPVQQPVVVPQPVQQPIQQPVQQAIVIQPVIQQQPDAPVVPPPAGAGDGQPIPPVPPADIQEP
jgi:hypothetical protein